MKHTLNTQPTASTSATGKAPAGGEESAVIDALNRLNDVFYPSWRGQLIAGDDENGYLSGTIPAKDLITIVDYARQQITERSQHKVNPAARNDLSLLEDLDKEPGNRPGMR